MRAGYSHYKESNSDNDNDNDDIDVLLHVYQINFQIDISCLSI